MDPEESEAALAALQHIQDILGGVQGLKKPADEPALDGPPEAGLTEKADAPAEMAEVENCMDEPAEASEPEPERFLEAMGKSPSKPTTNDVAIEIMAKRGPGRPKKVR